MSAKECGVEEARICKANSRVCETHGCVEQTVDDEGLMVESWKECPLWRDGVEEARICKANSRVCETHGCVEQTVDDEGLMVESWKECPPKTAE